MNKLGTILKEKREAAGLSQLDVSKSLGYTTPQFISNWERGISTPPVKTIKKIEKIYRQQFAHEVYNAMVEDGVNKLKSKFKKSGYAI